MRHGGLEDTLVPAFSRTFDHIIWKKFGSLTYTAYLLCCIASSDKDLTPHSLPTIIDHELPKFTLKGAPLKDGHSLRQVFCNEDGDNHNLSNAR